MTGYDIIARARELADVRGTDAIRDYADEDDPYFAVSAAFGTAQELLWQLATLTERLEADLAGDSRRLGEIRALLARFDWEHDDRQYALEAIDRIAGGAS